MSGPFSIDFRISGAGWADVELVFGAETFLCSSVSYLSDGLGELVRLAVMAGSGAQEALAFLEGEPDGWRIEMTPIGREMQLTVFATNDMADRGGEQVFRSDCGIPEFARAVLAAARAAETNFEAYSMGRFAFPRVAVNALEAVVLALDA